MRRAFIALCLVAGLLASGCTGTEQSGVQPGDGPAAEETEFHGPIEGEPSEESSPLQDDASFDEKYVYSDGLQVEVIKIRNGQFTAAQVEYQDNVKKGDPYTVFTIRVRNGSPKTYLEDETGDLSGKLIKGKSRSAGFVFLIPTRFYDDVVLEVSPDFEHDSAVFSGSIK